MPLWMGTVLQLRLENCFQVQQKLFPLRLLAQCQTETVCALSSRDRGQDRPRLPVQRIVQKQRRTESCGFRLILHDLLPVPPAARMPAHSACHRPE